MKLFTKLALVSAIAVSGSAMAMESMDDSALSATTGQDGISIGIGISKIAIGSVYVHDNDGLSDTVDFAGVGAAVKDKEYNSVFTTSIGSQDAADAGTAAGAAWLAAHPGDAAGAAAAGQKAAVGYAHGEALTAAGQVGANDLLGGTGNAGAIAITGNGIAGDANETDGIVITANTNSLLSTHNFADITIDTDGGTTGTGSDAFLNIGAEVSGLNIAIGNISVSASGTQAAPVAGAKRGIGADKNVILSGLTLTTGKTNANIQLGNTPQGAMILLNGTMQGGLTINNLGLVDNAGGGQITLGSLRVTDHVGNDLSTNAAVSVTDKGLEITAMKTATDMYIGGISLSGSATGANGAWVAGSSIGDVEISNMRVFNGTAGLREGAVITVAGH